MKMFIVAFCGPPCSGKSTLMEAVRRAQPDLSCHSVDDIRLTDPDLAGPINDKARRSAAYRILHFRAAQDLIGRKAVALDATYIPDEARAEIAAIALRFRVPLYVIQCVCPGEEAAAGFIQRKLSHAGSDLTVQRVKDLADGYERYEYALVINRHVMANGTQDAVCAVLRYLGSTSAVSPIQWAQHTYVPDRRSNVNGAVETAKVHKLSERTVRRARLSLWGYRVGFLAIISFAALSVLCVGWAGIRWWLRDLHLVKGLLFGLSADTLIALAVYLVAFAGLSAIIAAYRRDIVERWNEAETNRFSRQNAAVQHKRAARSPGYRSLSSLRMQATRRCKAGNAASELSDILSNPARIRRVLPRSRRAARI
jgi:predicted kinase